MMWWQGHLNEFITLFLIINPFGPLPTYLEVSAGRTPLAQRKIAFHAVLVSFVVLVFFVFAGSFLLRQMGIAVRAFQIAGGVILFLVALDMIRGDEHLKTADGDQGLLALAIYPLAIPKIAGPGAMLTVILLTDDDRYNFVGQLITMGLLAVVLVIQFALLLAAAPIGRVIGTAWISVISRVMGMVLAALAVGIILSTVSDWLGLPRP
jgi:multiple antibiotic resistance protein